MVYQLNKVHEDVTTCIPEAAKRCGVNISSQDGLTLVFDGEVSHRTIVKLIRYAYAVRMEKEFGVQFLTRDDVKKDIKGVIIPSEVFAFDKEALSYGASILAG